MGRLGWISAGALALVAGTLANGSLRIGVVHAPTHELATIASASSADVSPRGLIAIAFVIRARIG